MVVMRAFTTRRASAASRTFRARLTPGSAAPDNEFLHFGYVRAHPAEVRSVGQRLRAAGVLLVEDEDSDSNVGIKALDPDGYRIEISWES